MWAARGGYSAHPTLGFVPAAFANRAPIGCRGSRNVSPCSMFLQRTNIAIVETFFPGDSAPSPSRLTRWLVKRLRESIPATWTIEEDAMDSARLRGAPRPDLLLRVADSIGATAGIGVDVTRRSPVPSDMPILASLAERAHTPRLGTAAFATAGHERESRCARAVRRHARSYTKLAVAAGAGASDPTAATTSAAVFA